MEQQTKQSWKTIKIWYNVYQSIKVIAVLKGITIGELIAEMLAHYLDTGQAPEIYGLDILNPD